MRSDNRLVAARNLIKRAGMHALSAFGMNNDNYNKGVQDWVTEIDVEVENMICNEICLCFPEDGILGEESGYIRQAADYLWIVDPIDGTSCYMQGIPFWCVSISLMYCGEVIWGLVYDPCRDELFEATEGQGAKLNGSIIRVGEWERVNEGLVGVGYSHRSDWEQQAGFLSRLVQHGGMFLQKGSCALSLSYVANGRLLAYYEAHVFAWDAAAGIIIVHEAGGCVNHFFDGDGLVKGNAIFSANRRLMAQLQSMVPEKMVLS